MSWLELPWPGRDDPRPDDPSIRRDLRSGRAGVPLRLGLSLAAATMLFAGVMLVLGLIDTFGHVHDEHVAIAMAGAGAVWCGILVVLWSTYRRWRRLMQTIFIVLGIWFVTIPMCVLIAETIRASFLVAGVIFMSISATIVVIAANAYYATTGRAMEDREGRIVVECPNCRYSMVGLEGSTCPECGESYTIDQLIREQNYAALGQLAPGPAEQRDAEPADDEPAMGSGLPRLAE